MDACEMCDGPGGPVVVYDHALTLCEPCANEYAAAMDDTCAATMHRLAIETQRALRRLGFPAQ